MYIINNRSIMMMMAFTENKGKGSAKKQAGGGGAVEDSNNRRRDEKRRDKEEVGASWSEKQGEIAAAWHDPSVENLKVHIEDISRLRKLKKTEAETHITGDQYAQRLQEQYEKING